MSTTAQILANQANAKLSTGPSTPEGKSITSQNATPPREFSDVSACQHHAGECPRPRGQHGLSGAFSVLPNESQAEFDQKLANYRTTYKPQNDPEEFLVAQMVQSRWKLARINRLEAALVRQMIAADPEHTDADEVIAAAMLKGAAGPLAALHRYSAAAERAYYKALRELQRNRAQQSEQSGESALLAMLANPVSVPVQNEPNPARVPKPLTAQPAEARPSLASTLGNLALRL